MHLDASAELHPFFKSKVYEIAASVQNNDTEQPEYLSELMIRDYGTHYITSVEAGAVFAKVDSISATYANNIEVTNITSAAIFSFPLLQIFSVNSPKILISKLILGIAVCVIHLFFSIDMAFGGLYQTCHHHGREDVCARRILARIAVLHMESWPWCQRCRMLGMRT